MRSIASALATFLTSQTHLDAATDLASQRAPANVPSYVLDYAPLVYLYSADPYRPSDIGAQLSKTVPEVNYTAVSGSPTPLTLDNLDALNDPSLGNSSVYLTSKDHIDVNNNPLWTKGVVPNAAGKTEGAISSAIIVNAHDDVNVDVIYMYFYAFNYGGTVLDVNLGNHVGDWEQNMIRFEGGLPTQVWYSQHSYGEAFEYAALNKTGNRPIAYSANGSHAVYATSGTHDHTIPNLEIPEGLLVDHTDAGVLWDPTLSAYYYTYNASTGVFATYDDITPSSYLNYNGRWGDQQYSDEDPRQVNFLDLNAFYRYEGGPAGPKDKQLNRTQICPESNNPCIIRETLMAKQDEYLKVQENYGPTRDFTLY